MRVSCIRWDTEQNCLILLDQTLLPETICYIQCHTVQEVATAITSMQVRGAPAIGAAGAYGMALALLKPSSNPLQTLEDAKDILDAARPTAVNLSWATSRVLETCRGSASFATALQEANAIAEQDVALNKRLGAFGAALLPEKGSVLHHCNTGHLATVGHGTALGVIYSAVESGKEIHVFVDETRPRLQGARLTAWELMESGVPMHLIVDGCAASLLRAGKVSCVLFGADRVARNGDVANKIGTYGLALAAHANGVPVYAAVPTSTIDFGISDGSQIHIEERAGEEVSELAGSRIAPKDVPVYNPAFDVTPHHLITAIVTERGVCYPPFEQSLARART